MIHLPDIFENGLVWNNIHQANLYLAKKKVKMVMQNILTCFYNALKWRIEPKFWHSAFNTIERNWECWTTFLSFLPCPHGATKNRIRLHPNLYQIIIFHGCIFKMISTWWITISSFHSGYRNSKPSWRAYKVINKYKLMWRFSLF